MMSAKQTKFLVNQPPGEEIVISGIAGQFPKSNSIAELQENLFNKVDLVSDLSNEPFTPSTTIKRIGKINNVNKLDADFFSIEYDDAHFQNPMCRILLEQAYEAIIDAGINPAELCNTKTGVFVASILNDCNKTLQCDKLEENSKGIIGCSEASIALRISNWLKVKGPAYKLDSACCGSLYALEQGYNYLRNGTIDYAIVSGVNLNLLNENRQFDEMGMLSKDGRCKSFDISANGFVRAEAAVTCFLQKAKNSRRIYAQIVHSKTKCFGFNEHGITHPSSEEEARLLKIVYEECNIPPQSVEFVEFHGTGTAVGDPLELKAVDAVMCPGRTKPLLIGSVKSNMGHSESAAALCSVAKLCIAYNTGFIAPNINFWKCREDIPGLTEGRMKVITEKRTWNRGLTGVTSVGFGGSVAHAIFKNIAKDKECHGLPKDDLPRLVCVSGRTREAVVKIFDNLEAKAMDIEEIRLWHAIHEQNIMGHKFRGYTLLRSSPDVCGVISLNKKIQRFSSTLRKVCYLYSGIELQKTTRILQLMEIPKFASSINKCHSALKVKGIDLIKNISHSNLNAVNSFICVTAIQIALTDLLEDIGIKPDHVIGHDGGVVACAYADGIFTTEQTMLVAYYQAIRKSLLAGNYVATVMLEYDKLRSMCPPEIDLLDASDSCLIMGPEEIARIFSKSLHTKGIETKQVKDVDLDLKITKHLEEIIKLNKGIKTKRRITTPTLNTNYRKQTEPAFPTPEYYAKKIMEPNSLHETCQMIPADCIYIEMSPQLVFKTYLEENEKTLLYTGILHDIKKKGIQDLFTSLGKLFLYGLNPRLANLYPHIPFPVSQGTPMLSHCVEWDHRDQWFTNPIDLNKLTSVERNIIVDIENEGYLNGHSVDGRVLYPATGYVVLVWQTLALMMQEYYQNVSVVFEDLRFERSTIVPKKGQLELTVMIHKVTGAFEICEKSSTIVTGRVYVKNDVGCSSKTFVHESHERHNIVVNSEDFYKLLHLKGYGHSHDFCGIMGCNVEGTYFKIKWSENWVTFLDSLLQTYIFKEECDGLRLPTRIEKISIDISAHYASLKNITDPKVTTGYWEKYLNIIRSAGVEIRGLHFTSMARRPDLRAPLLKKYVFIPFEEQKVTLLESALRASIEIILENIRSFTFKCIEVFDEYNLKHFSKPLIQDVSNILNEHPTIKPDLELISDTNTDILTAFKENNAKKKHSNAVLVIGINLCEKPNEYEQILRDQGFILSRETTKLNKISHLNNYNVISQINTEDGFLVLLRKKGKPRKTNFVELKMSDEAYSWIDEVKKCIDNENLFVVYSRDDCSGLVGFINCLRKEPGGENVRGFLIKDTSAPPFNPDIIFYKQQLVKDLLVNVYDNGNWGTYRHLLLNDIDKTVNVDNAYIDIGTIGNLNTLKWFEGPLSANKKVELPLHLVHVYCAALNFRDVVTATGRVSMISIRNHQKQMYYSQGGEFAGRLDNGMRVMGLASKSISNLTSVSSNLIMAIPDEWSFAEGATVFVTYLTAYAGLVVYGKIKRGDAVLIHAGAGGVGQSAINIALSYGAKVFTTVGSEEKRTIIKKLYPQIQDDQIGYSRDTSFEEIILQKTEGRGVDIVLNSFAEEQLLATARCLAFRGKFIEIGKADIERNLKIEMDFYQKEISFHGVSLEYILPEFNKTLLKLLYDGIVNGVVKPLTHCVFDKDEVTPAYKYFAKGKNVGKIVIKIRDDDSRGINTPIAPLKMKAIRRYICDSNNVYILVGGLGGFGMELADWLTLRGAKKLLIVSRRGITNGYQALKISAWKSSGVTVIISTHDVTKLDECQEMLELALSMGRVEAVFHLAVILKDASLQQQTRDTFKAAYEPKASVALNLDKLTRIFCPTLKNFVLFSSWSCGFGNAGQTNYALANSVMERLCEKRKKEGLPALAIQWGAIGDVGMYVKLKIKLLKNILSPQSIKSCLCTLDQFLNQENAVVASYLTGTETDDVKQSAVTGVDAIAKIMGIKDMKSISYQIPLAQLGMDSIVAMEIKQTLERNFEVFLSAKETRDLTFARLTELLEDQNPSNITPQCPNELNVVKSPADEYTIQKPYIFIPSKDDHINGESGNEVCSNPIVFVVPGVDSSAASLETFCLKLKTKTCILQLGLEHIDEGIPSMADRLYKTMKLHLDTTVPFTLIGYSYGSMLVLELAARLESEGLRGTVFCIDGSPLWIKTMVTSRHPNKNSVTLQDDVIQVVIPSGRNMKCSANINNNNLFDEKIEHVLKNVSVEGYNYSTQYFKSIIKAIYNRMNCMYDYNIDEIKMLESSIILIRTDKTAIKICKSYGLDKVAKNKLDVNLIKANHTSIIENSLCVEIIKKYLNDNNNNVTI